MPTIETTPAPRVDDSPGMRRHGRRMRRNRLSPLLLVLLVLVAAAGWRVATHATATSSREREDEVAITTRTASGVRLELPSAWKQLDRTTDRSTWGTPDRTSTVTVASTEASGAPLGAVVREVVRESVDQLDGLQVVAPPVPVDVPPPAPRGDAAVLVRLRLPTGGRPLDVVQVWRRDSRSGRDVVATWTSGDGHWPVDPRDAVPSA